MTIPTEVRPIVRERANFVCEYCGVRESDVGGELTIDHFDPRSHGGMDHPDNLIYCCQRCNGYKADYFPINSTDRPLWNPRRELSSAHFLVLEDGLLHPRTGSGAFTIQRCLCPNNGHVEHSA